MKAFWYVVSVLSTIGIVVEFNDLYFWAELIVKNIFLILFVVSIDKMNLFKK